jgi:acetyl-CoA acetyltransferase family protein
MPTEVFVVGGARTPMATYMGSLKTVSADQLGTVAARAALDRSQVRPEWVDHVVFGQVMPTSAYSTRHLALNAGIPIEVPAFAVNRLCGSGLQAVIEGAQMIQLGEADIVMAGGMESMSQAPHVLREFRSGKRMGSSTVEDTLLTTLFDSYCGSSMAATAEKCAAQYEITRLDQDAYALRSQQLAARAWAEGRLAEEVTPVEVASRKGTETVAKDDHLRPDTSEAGLAKLSPVDRGGSVTAGNASGIVDGAAAVLLASEKAVRERGLTPLGRLEGWATAGVDPSIMGMGPVPATRRLLARTGRSLGDLDLIEVNEAFAGQYLAVEKELGLDRDKVNVNGGAIALGHPLGMTGTRLLLTLLLELRRRGVRRGLAAACIGGGQGIAALVETT